MCTVSDPHDGLESHVQLWVSSAGSSFGANRILPSGRSHLINCFLYLSHNLGIVNKQNISENKNTWMTVGFL
jgi:hypothetical protein